MNLESIHLLLCVADRKVATLRWYEFCTPIQQEFLHPKDLIFAPESLRCREESLLSSEISFSLVIGLFDIRNQFEASKRLFKRRFGASRMALTKCDY